MTSQNFASKSGSEESLKTRVKWGLISFSLQTRCTVALETPNSRAMARQVQRARPCGGRVACSTIWRKSSVLRRLLRPERGSSCSAPSPPLRYRLRHLATWLRCIPTCRPMARTPIPLAANCTTRARCANPCGVLWARINCCNCSLSAALNTNFPRCFGIQTPKHIFLSMSLLFKRH